MSWRYFRVEEFACRHCGANLICPDFVDKLDALRAQVGFALPVTSGYRCPAHNQAVSTTGPAGPHTTGRAVDLAVDRERALRVLEVVLAQNNEAVLAGRGRVWTGVGVKQKGGARFLHLDDLAGATRPSLWSY
jgi:hypothetical protein